MAFTRSEKIRIALSDAAFYHYHRTHDWVKAYRAAAHELRSIVSRELKEVIANLEDNEDEFIKDEFIQ